MTALETSLETSLEALKALRTLAVVDASTHVAGSPSVRLGDALLALEWGDTSIEFNGPDGSGKKMAIVIIRALIAAVLRENEIGGLK